MGKRVANGDGLTVGYRVVGERVGPAIVCAEDKINNMIIIFENFNGRYFYIS